MTTTKTLSDFSMMDTFDSRDLIARMEELQAMKEGGLLDDDDDDDLVEMEELEALEEVNKEGERSSDVWNDGVTCIRDSYFKDYAYGYAEDMGLISQNIQWPNTCIDWAGAARELQVDYTEIEVDGVTFWVR